MPELVEIPCIRCGTRWYVDLAQLEGPTQVIYKTLDSRGRVETYRIRCPACGTYNMVDVEIEEGNDG
jgi:hypothetical protein